MDIHIEQVMNINIFIMYKDTDIKITRPLLRAQTKDL